MTGSVDLSTPWARAGMTPEDRVAIASLVPDGMSLGVSVAPDRSRWVLWLVDRGEPITSQLRVSSGLSLVDACRWALVDHWKVAT